MKLYYYIHTGHRYGLDRLRRGAVLYKKLKEQGINAEVLLNDYRATIVAKELGIEASTPIDAVYNIATIAEAGDGLIIDTPELTDELLKQICGYFKVVVNFSEEKAKYNEKIISSHFEDKNSAKMLLIDDKYFQKYEKNDKTLLFIGDEDYEKSLLKEKELYEDMDLLAGHYFFLNYEKELQNDFNDIVEDYEMLTLYKNFVTKSFQSALEAAASGACIYYVGEQMLSLVTLQNDLAINTVKMGKDPINGDFAKPINKNELEKISKNLNYKSIFNKLDLCQFKFN